MKFLFDQNLSRRLTVALSDVYPGSVHVSELGFQTATDLEVWSYAADRNLAIVSKDSDFRQLSFRYGPPPKVVWIRMGNCSTDEIGHLLRTRQAQVARFAADAAAAFLALG